MYTLLELESKTLAALKEIGHELNVFPKDDRRRRQSWIDALVNVNPPLLQLLEVAPAASVEQVQPIRETVEASPAVEAEPVQVPIESKFGRIVYPQPAQGAISQVAKTSPGVEVEQVQEQYPRNARRDCPQCVGVQSLYWTRNFCMEEWVIRCLYCDYERPKNPRFAHLEPPVYGPEEYPDKVEALRQACAFQAPPPPYSKPGDYCCTWAPITVPPTKPPVADSLNNAPKCPECFDDRYIENEFGLITRCHQCNKEPKLSRQKTQKAIVPVTKNSPGIEVSVSDRKRYWADRGFFLIPEIPTAPEQNPAVEFDGCIYCTSPEYKLWRNETYRCYRCEPEPDQNPILTGITFSDRFLTRYAPPQAEIIHFQPDADGQLSLLNFDIESVDEPPDPDDFASIEEFQEALGRWDAENAEMLAVSIDSMCEWAPCPDEWYEPEPESLPLKASSMMELSPPAIECSITSANFTIPTFDAWCDRANRQTDTDEPPDTGISVRLPKPKPPKFPPQAASQPLVNQVSRNYPETIPKLFHRVAAGSSTQPARSPPGGDAM
jgi:hypothetical protein